MMIDNLCPPGNGAVPEDGAGEDTRLLSSSPPSSSTYAIFNDLTYSDDDDDLGDDYWDTAELGVSGSISSPETAALLDQIQNAMFPVQQSTSTAAAATASQQQQQQQQQSAHLMHPLARHESAQSSEGDDGSYLAYSLNSTSIMGDDESKQASISSTAAVTNGTYGSLDGPPFDFKPKSPGVIFRPPSSVFDSSRSNASGPSPPPGSGQQHQQYQRQTSSPKTSPKRTNLKPRPGRVENSHPNQSSVLQSTSNGRYQQKSPPTNGKQPVSIGIGSCCYPQPSTPLPSISSESPVTSATAGTTSPDRREDEEELPEEKERITRLLSEEATKRLRRHRRLKRIKKAAEAREAAVKKVRGVEQRGRCNDAIFAFIFLCQFLMVSMSAVAFGPGALRDKIYGELVNHDDTSDGDLGEEAAVKDYNPFAGLQTDDIVIIDNPLAARGGSTSGIHRRHKEKLEDMVADGISHIDYINVIQLLCITAGWASLCSLLVLGFMMMLSNNLIHATLVFTVGIAAVWTVLGLALGAHWAITAAGAAALALSVAYSIVVWDRIPFAATNLGVALKGMRGTLDVPFVGLCVLGVMFFWTMWWICAFVGTLNFLNDDENLSNNWMSVVILFFVFSYYWTFQVIKGTSQTTVASIIGKWWDMSEEDPLPLCSGVLQGTFSRNIIGSFGSICMGSLIVEPCILLSRFSTFGRLARPKLDRLSPKILSSSKQPPSSAAAVEQNGKCESGGCLADNGSIISRNVNQWSFTYIGLYGYKFWDSGSKASQLFEARGWTHVVSDDLIMTVMTMTSLIIGGSTACLGLIVEEVDGYSFTSLNKPITTAFLIGLFVGYFLSSAFLSIVEGSVSAILVCYAAAPVEFHANHHKLSEEMKTAWKHFWLPQKPR